MSDDDYVPKAKGVELRIISGLGLREEIELESDLYLVRLYDWYDGCWIDVTEPMSREEAERVWMKKTRGGTVNTRYAADGVYYKVFPADTNMLYDSSNPAKR